MTAQPVQQCVNTNKVLSWQPSQLSEKTRHKSKSKYKDSVAKTHLSYSLENLWVAEEKYKGGEEVVDVAHAVLDDDVLEDGGVVEGDLGHEHVDGVRGEAEQGEEGEAHQVLTSS